MTFIKSKSVYDKTSVDNITIVIEVKIQQMNPKT